MTHLLGAATFCGDAARNIESQVPQQHRGAKLCLAVAMALVCGLPAVFADDTAQSPETAQGQAEEQAQAEEEVPAGHSMHGEAFNEGPRQRAYLMEGTGRVHFPVTTDHPRAQEFINQGVGQLHGFWYFEAERSFRQAAAIDPDCAMAYWGMARANVNNEKRAKQLTAEAVERRQNATERETMYIEALDAYYQTDASKKKKRAQDYVKALEQILHKYPEDIEAKAFLGLQLWVNRRNGIPISSYFAVDALLKQVLDVEPMHPCHHYIIHLWDYEKPERALDSSALCGPAAPAIAHMWHMPGHIYSRLKRYADAAWQQEASARVDHAQMMRDRLLPDQIHNFAHNNEWLIRNLSHVGRVHEAVDLAKNMIELPRHPGYNTLGKRGSAHYGRLRLFEVLARYELWDELIALADTPYLEPTDQFDEQVRRLRHLGIAYFRRGEAENGRAQLAMLKEKLNREKKARDAAVAEAVKAHPDEDCDNSRDNKDDDAEASPEKNQAANEKTEEEQKQETENGKKLEEAKEEAAKPFVAKIDRLEGAVNELKGHAAVARDDYEKALSLFKQAGGVDPMYVARVHLMAGDEDEAEKKVRDLIKSHRNEVQPLAHLVDILWQTGQQEAAGKAFHELRERSAHIDLEAPPFARLAPVAGKLGLPEDWRLASEPADDIGERPDLDSLGPFRWQPSPAADWALIDAEGRELSLNDYRGRPIIVIFYLGYGCLHCVEQLHAFGPHTREFEEAGISLLAISTDNRTDLNKSLDNYEEGTFPFPLVSDAGLDVFKAYRAFDDFEEQPLHGTFLIDGDGLVRWQDIGHEPFMDPDFVLQEARRLLSQP